MSYKRPRLHSSNASRRSLSQSISRRSSVSQNIQFSSPHLPPLSQRKREEQSISAARSIHTPSARNADDVNSHDVECEADIQRREAADNMNEIIMALVMKDRGTLGCSYYVAREEKLYLMQDVQMADLDLVDTLKIYIQPTVVLISTRSDETLEERLNKEARGIDRGDNANDVFGLYVLDSRPSSEFSYLAAKNKLVNLGLDAGSSSDMTLSTPGDDLKDDGYAGDHGEGRQGRLLRLSGKVDVESRLTVGCAGAILSYLARRKTIEYLPNDEAALVTFRIRTAETFVLSDIMYVNADTLASLQIIQSESHPNSHMQGPNKSTSGAKESLSVFGLFYHLAGTPQGKQKLRQLFLRPSLDLSVIKERLNTVSILVRPENAAATETIIRCLKRIKDVRAMVIHLQKGISNTNGKSSNIQRGVWASLRSFTFHALKLIEAFRELNGCNSLPIVARVYDLSKDLLACAHKWQFREELHPQALHHVGQMITETIDFPRSAEQHRTTVLPGVDEELDAIRQTYDGMDSLLTKVAIQLSEEAPEWAAQYIENCIFFPQLGFLTVTPLDPETGKGRYEGEGSANNDVWERMFVSNDMGYYKNSRMKEMDAHFGDMYGLICDKEIEIIHDLTVKILEHESVLIAASDLCGELDSLVALSWGARMHGFNMPRMTNANVLHIQQGRHPLQELTVPAYIPNDCFLTGGIGADGDVLSPVDSDNSVRESVESHSMLIMTGPNYSGKSVYLKQNALIVYLAHIGSFVPAESATIGITDKILTRIATRESVSRNQSAFMIDLQQVALAMRLATRRSLIVVDEFGKGTNSIDGASLACGVFEYFLNLDNRPKVLGATHFHEIFESGYLKPRLELSFGHMEVRVDVEAQMLEDQITYLYSFKAGRSMSSFGTCCASLNGIDPLIVERADELILLLARGEDIVAACSTVSADEAAELKNAERIGRRFLEQDFPTAEGSGKGKFDVRSVLRGILAVKQ